MNLAERKRQLVRDELTEAALKLLAYQGYEQTTIDQIVAAAGVSRRTFFRYFQSKEDVIIEFLGHLGLKLSEALAAQPEDLSPIKAMRGAFVVFTEAYQHNTEKSIKLARLTIKTPALMGRYLERQIQWRADAAAELGRRMQAGPADLGPSLTAAVGFAAFDTAVHAWVDADGTQDLDTLLDKAFELVFRDR